MPHGIGSWVGIPLLDFVVSVVGLLHMAWRPSDGRNRAAGAGAGSTHPSSSSPSSLRG